MNNYKCFVNLLLINTIIFSVFIFLSRPSIADYVPVYLRKNNLSDNPYVNDISNYKMTESSTQDELPNPYNFLKQDLKTDIGRICTKCLSQVKQEQGNPCSCYPCLILSSTEEECQRNLIIIGKKCSSLNKGKYIGEKNKILKPIIEEASDHLRLTYGDHLNILNKSNTDQIYSYPKTTTKKFQEDQSSTMLKENSTDDNGAVDLKKPIEYTWLEFLILKVRNVLERSLSMMNNDNGDKKTMEKSVDNLKDSQQISVEIFEDFQYEKRPPKTIFYPQQTNLYPNQEVNKYNFSTEYNQKNSSYEEMIKPEMSISFETKNLRSNMAEKKEELKNHDTPESISENIKIESRAFDEPNILKNEKNDDNDKTISLKEETLRDRYDDPFHISTGIKTDNIYLNKNLPKIVNGFKNTPTNKYFTNWIGKKKNFDDNKYLEAKPEITEENISLKPIETSINVEEPYSLVTECKLINDYFNDWIAKNNNFDEKNYLEAQPEITEENISLKPLETGINTEEPFSQINNDNAKSIIISNPIDNQQQHSIMSFPLQKIYVQLMIKMNVNINPESGNMNNFLMTGKTNDDNIITEDEQIEERLAVE